MESKSTTSAVSRPAEASGLVDRVIRPLTHLLNPLMLRIAGGWWFPMFSLLHHRGHKSGRLYATPISAMPRGGFFWLAVTFGENAGWVRNIMAAGEADLRYRGVDYHLVEAVMLEGSAVRSELPPVVHYGMPLLGVRKVIRMRAIARR